MKGQKVCFISSHFYHQGRGEALMRFSLLLVPNLPCLEAWGFACLLQALPVWKKASPARLRFGLSIWQYPVVNHSVLYRPFPFCTDWRMLLEFIVLLWVIKHRLFCSACVLSAKLRIGVIAVWKLCEGCTLEPLEENIFSPSWLTSMPCIF